MPPFLSWLHWAAAHFRDIAVSALPARDAFASWVWKSGVQLCA